VQGHIKKLMPSCRIIDTSGGCIILNLPFENASEMKYFISILNHRYDQSELKPLEGLIRECGMDYTTLEEIFLKVIKIIFIFYLDYFKESFCFE
jgi:hypothetical protein